MLKATSKVMSKVPKVTPKVTLKVVPKVMSTLLPLQGLEEIVKTMTVKKKQRRNATPTTLQNQRKTMMMCHHHQLRQKVKPQKPEKKEGSILIQCPRTSDIELDNSTINQVSRIKYSYRY